MFKLLNLNNNYRIVKVKEEEQMDGRKEMILDLDLKIERIRKSIKCPKCNGDNIIIHSRNNKRKVLHLIQENGKRVYINIPKIRFKCKDCLTSFINI